jgi:hypothetical protein
VYENGKMRPVETIQRMAGGRIQENYWKDGFSYDIL